MVKRLFIIICACVMLTACAATNVVDSVSRLTNEYDSGRMLDTIKSIDYSTEDEMAITHAVNFIAYFRSKYGEYLMNPEKLVTLDTYMLQYNYDQLKKQYEKIELVIARNYDQYPDEAKARLKAYGHHAKMLDKSIEKLVENKQYTEMIRTGLSFAFTTLQVIGGLR